MYMQKNSEKIHYLIGQRVYKKRKELGYTGSELALLLGVSQQQVSRYERGKNRVDLLHLFQIAIVLNTPMNWFLEDITAQLDYFLTEQNEVSVDETLSTLNMQDAIQLRAETTLNLLES
ncbi:helix-turn-helix domain-containing protein [Providencia burhodogranariea]|uniref:HTH cro/C1-type domain-containing protein n=1 Tax=Providencia burhodogranariea DSM 19968 TaxID=1141662 RepID=K8WJM9_9GAMM|nr:hypothetical protein OOA_11988 [Providencia burhodogranariea DSM 19968]